VALKPTIARQNPQRVTEGFRDPHQRAQITKGGERDLLTHDKTDVRTGCSLGAQPQELAQRIHGDMGTPVPEQAAAQACVGQDGVGIDPKLTQHARDNGREAQVEEATFSRAWRGLRGGGGGLHGSDPILAAWGLTWIDPGHRQQSWTY
jgi:hypothetical protein